MTAEQFSHLNALLGLGITPEPTDEQLRAQIDSHEIDILSLLLLARLGGSGGSGEGDAATLNGAAGAFYLARANHTGVQAISTITNLQAALDALTSGKVSLTAFPWMEGFALSDETTALTAGTEKLVHYMPYAMTVTGVFLCCRTAPTGATLICDINKNDVTMLSTKLSIDATENHSLTALVPPVISVSALGAGDKLSFDFDQVGATIAGAGVKVVLTGTRNATP